MGLRFGFQVIGGLVYNDLYEYNNDLLFLLT